jgi:sugar/nucleoside kinase (ribokinase family)
MNKYMVSIGDVALDIFSKIKVREIKAELCYATDTPAITSIHPGGSAANFATWISRLGGNSAFIGRVGNDFIGDYLIKDLENEGVVLNISKGSGFTAIIIALIDRTGERTMVTHRGESINLSLKDVDFNLISKASLIFIPAYSLFTGEISKTVLKLLSFKKYRSKITFKIDLPNFKKNNFNKEDLNNYKEYKNKNNIPLIAIDLSSYGAIKKYGPKEFENLLKDIKPDILFCNKNELIALKPNLNFNEAIIESENLSPIVIVKLGKKGCIVNYLNENAKENVFRVKAKKVKVIDTTGAGDAFDAAFCYKYLKSRNVKKSAEFANSLASLVITKYGARPKIDFISIKNL